MTSRPRTLWFALRLAAAALVAAIAIALLSSWVLALLVGSVTIVFVVIDGIVLSRASADQVAVDGSPTPSATLNVDLRRRR